MFPQTENLSGRASLRPNRSPDYFGKRFREALERRLYPKTNIHPDQFAYALGMDGRSIRNWLRGDNQPSGFAVYQVIQFFASQGDMTILRDIYGDVVTPMVQRNEKGDRALKLLKELHDLSKDVA